VIDFDGKRRCSCGATGHLEAYTSGPAMAQRYRELSGTRESPDLKAIAATGPTRYAIEDGRVVFSPLPNLAPKADTTYQIKVQALRKGDQRVRVQLQTDDMNTPVTKEESTRVYADE